METSASKDIIDGECLLPNFHPDHYKKLEDLGRGAYGRVSKLRHVERGSSEDGLPLEVALKTIEVRSPTGDDLREYKILKECNHANILKLFYWKIVEVKDLPKHLYLYTELCDSNLRKFMADNELERHTLKKICIQIIKGCIYLHSQSVVHRDIKPENILIVGKPLTVKIADFGFARFMPKEAIESSRTFSTLGTKIYAPPEVIQAFNASESVQPKSKFATDIFSLGVVIFEIFAKKLPFSIKDLGKKAFDVDKIVRDNITDPMLVDCLIPMLQWNPKLRPESKEIISMKFFPWQSFNVIQVEQVIFTLHHLPEIDVLILGFWDGSLLTVNSEGGQNECVQKHRRRIDLIRHHGDIIAVADGDGNVSLWKYSEKTRQLEFLQYLQEQADENRLFDSIIDISAKYIAYGRGQIILDKGELTVWIRESEEGESVTKKIAEHKFDDCLQIILIHDNYIMCGMWSGLLIIYDPEEKSVLKRLRIDVSLYSITKSDNQVYLNVKFSKGIFCMNDQFEVNKVINTSGYTQQIMAYGGNLYCLREDGGLKCFSLASLAPSFKKEADPLNWIGNGTAIMEAGDKKYGLNGDMFQISHSTLFIVPPENDKIVKIVRLL